MARLFVVKNYKWDSLDEMNGCDGGYDVRVFDARFSCVYAEHEEFNPPSPPMQHRELRWIFPPQRDPAMAVTAPSKRPARIPDRKVAGASRRSGLGSRGFTLGVRRGKISGKIVKIYI